jgi:hypothetical protein
MRRNTEWYDTPLKEACNLDGLAVKCSLWRGSDPRQEI